MVQGIYAGDTFLPCKGVAFDKDGTLIDIFSMLSRLGQERYRHISSAVGKDALQFYRKCTGFDPATGKVDPYGPLASASRRDEVAVAACALWLAGIPWYKAIALAREAYDRADQTLDPTEGVRLLPGVKDALISLSQSGLRLSVVTSDGHIRTQKMLSFLGIADLVDLIVAADDVENPKPSPDAVMLVAKNMNISPSQIVVVGDTPQDAIMGKEAGAKTVGVLSGVAPRQDLERFFDIVIEGVKDIRPAPTQPVR
ncbi:MAG: HAD family hydrolase [Candidatus Fermentithermobacillus carboniphilus]|uniref:HAD family hydrolase n=1 Tax=Candidatus Fermentithermobacillus carboniphilus TaxID=3085328 RepID=A0AAT9L9M5_9FIRM|nr:MAG: HAD family hydrolase [Candidatus Fermentithermobacillus carboniphilus]